MKIAKVHGDQAARGHRDNVQFELSAEPGRQVFVAGTFNNWNPDATPLMDQAGNGHYKGALHVPQGTHEYKFVVNGVWLSDPKCVDCVPNGYGSMNSVIHV